ncbi:CYTH domain-containing protein [Roseomonas sp. CECT 9278]|uniref:CYTH domain-containing protein n=1 Tax=Roseomonas sp. CECT 9278 TaxID=2845823 RepID=UPI001E5E1FFB|nr:CYTH domain-containing protein [Roseomonas sp. CECT 9278]CAH0311979.1 Inorganic triphosphatase [Roseomonas sp. CECT 9278]
MKHEIERKFLVIDDGWRAAVTETVHLRDGLVATFGGGKVRVRIATAQGAPPRAWVTLKGPRSGISRREFEYAIPLAEAEAMLAEFCDGHVVEKHRHLVPHAGQVWEVDVYGGPLTGVVHAEIELDSATAAVIPPPWLGPEVTGQPQHSKRALIIASVGAQRDVARRQGI